MSATDWQPLRERYWRETHNVMNPFNRARLRCAECGKPATEQASWDDAFVPYVHTNFRCAEGHVWQGPTKIDD